jgi:hypothetical protein
MINIVNTNRNFHKLVFQAALDFEFCKKDSLAMKVLQSG